MAGGQERVLRRRIKSVQSTKKITKAMELIAASRIVKAQQRVAAARPYSEQITEVIRNLAAAGAGGDSPLLEPREEISTVAYVVIAADRGLAGGYNSSVIRLRRAGACSPSEAEGRQTALVTVGKKAHGYFRFRGYEIAESFSGFSDDPTYEDARGVAAFVAERFERASTTRCASSTPSSSRSAPSGRPIAHVHAARRGWPSDDADAATGPPPTTSSSPSPTRSSSGCCPATPRPGSSPPCSTPPPPSTPPASGP